MAQSDWDWHGMETQQDVVFPSVQAVAVYQNAVGYLVIRQQGAVGEDDSLIVVPRGHVDALLDAINTMMAPVL